MARFLTVEMMVARLGEQELHQTAGTGSWNHPQGRTLDTARIDTAIAWADDIVSGYVLARHPWAADLAPAEQPSTLVDAALDLARFRLRDEGGNKSQVSEDVRTRYTDAIARLKDIQAGRFDLPAPASVGAAAPDGPIGQVLAAPGRRRAEALLDGWREPIR